MLRMEHLVDDLVWKAAARPVDLFYKTYLSGESLSCTARTATTIYHPSPCRGIPLCRVNNRKYCTIKYLNMSAVARKPLRLPTRSNANQAVQPQKMTRGLKLWIYLRSPYLIIISAICHCHSFKNELVLVLNTAWRKQPIADYVSNHNRTCGESVSENSE